LENCLKLKRLSISNIKTAFFAKEHHNIITKSALNSAIHKLGFHHLLDETSIDEEIDPKIIFKELLREIECNIFEEQET